MPRTKKKSYSFSVGCQLIIMFVEGFFLSANLVYIDKFLFSIYVYVRLTRSMGSVEAPLSVCKMQTKTHFKSSTWYWTNLPGMSVEREIFASWKGYCGHWTAKRIRIRQLGSLILKYEFCDSFESGFMRNMDFFSKLITKYYAQLMSLLQEVRTWGRLWNMILALIYSMVMNKMMEKQA